MRCHRSLVVFFAVAVGACVVDGGTPPSSPSSMSADAIYDDNHVLEVSIQLSEDDWDALRTTTRVTDDVLGENCHLAPAVSPYAYVPADIVIDGHVFTNVGVRKKGFFGTQSDTKPSLKVKLDAFTADQNLFGITDITLNNNLSEPSQIRQCLGYLMVEAAGLPAPRCTIATVLVNDVALGVFTHLEPIKKPFLRRHFDSDDGNLYEGAFSDFRPGWVNSFEQKTNESDRDRTDLSSVVDALTVPDDGLIDALDAVVDLDRFYTHWALEVLLMHVDGYTRSTNNFFVYRDPANEKFVFFPWGIDVILIDDQPWFLDVAPVSAATWPNGALAHRLYRLPEGRAAFADRLQLLLDEVWREDTWLSEIDRFSDIVRPLLVTHSDEEQALILSSIDDVRAFVRTRRATLESALAALPDWEHPLPPSLCLVDDDT